MAKKKKIHRNRLFTSKAEQDDWGNRWNEVCMILKTQTKKDLSTIQIVAGDYPSFGVEQADREQARLDRIQRDTRLKREYSRA